MDGESTIAKLEKYMVEVSKQLQSAPECQAHSEDQICTVNGFAVRRMINIMWILFINECVCGIQLQISGEYAWCTK